MNWLTQKADGAWAERIQQENEAWAIHNYPRYNQAPSDVSLPTSSEAPRKKTLNRGQNHRRLKHRKSAVVDHRSIAQSTSVKSISHHKFQSQHAYQLPPESESAHARINRKLQKRDSQDAHSLRSSMRFWKPTIASTKDLQAESDRQVQQINERFTEEDQEAMEVDSQPTKGWRMMKKMQQRNPHMVSNNSLQKELDYENKLQQLILNQHQKMVAQMKDDRPSRRADTISQLTQKDLDFLKESSNFKYGNKRSANGPNRKRLRLDQRSSSIVSNADRRKPLDVYSMASSDILKQGNPAKVQYYQALQRMKNNEISDNAAVLKAVATKKQQRARLKSANPYDFQRNPEKVNNIQPEDEEEGGEKLAYSKELIERILTSICRENKKDDPTIKVYKNHVKINPLSVNQATISTKPSDKASQKETKFFKPYDTFSRETKESERRQEAFDLRSEFLNGKVSKYAGAREIEFKSRAAQNKQRVQQSEKDSQSAGSMRLLYLTRLKQQNKTSRFNEDFQSECRSTKNGGGFKNLAQVGPPGNPLSSRQSAAGSVRTKVTFDGSSRFEGSASKSKLTKEALSKMSSVQYHTGGPSSASKRESAFSRRDKVVQGQIESLSRAASQSMLSKMQSDAGTSIHEMYFDQLRQHIMMKLNELPTQQLMLFCEYFQLDVARVLDGRSSIQDLSQVADSQYSRATREELIPVIAHCIVLETQQRKAEDLASHRSERPSSAARSSFRPPKLNSENPYEDNDELLIQENDFPKYSNLSQHQRRSSAGVYSKGDDASSSRKNPPELDSHLFDLKERLYCEKQDRMKMENEVMKLRQIGERMLFESRVAIDAQTSKTSEIESLKKLQTIIEKPPGRRNTQQVAVQTGGGSRKPKSTKARRQKRRIDIDTEGKENMMEKDETGSAMMTAKFQKAQQNRKEYLRQASLDKLILRSLKKEKDQKQTRLDQLNRQMLYQPEFKKPTKYDPKLFKRYQ